MQILDYQPEKTFEIEITFKVGFKTETTKFNLTIKNPCVDPEYFKIISESGDSLPDLTYAIGSGPVVFEPHGNFGI